MITTMASPPEDKRCAPSPEMKRRMEVILKTPSNQVCADCPAKRPLWVSFILSASTGVSDNQSLLGVLCCASCAQHHYFELGEKRCHIKYIKMAHECTYFDVCDYCDCYILSTVIVKKWVSNCLSV